MFNEEIGFMVFVLCLGWLVFVVLFLIGPNVFYGRLKLSDRARKFIYTIHNILIASLGLLMMLSIVLVMFKSLPYQGRIISRMHKVSYGSEHGACVGDGNVYWRLHPAMLDKNFQSGSLAVFTRLDETAERVMFRMESDCTAGYYVIRTPIRDRLLDKEESGDVKVCVANYVSFFADNGVTSDSRFWDTYWNIVNDQCYNRGWMAHSSGDGMSPWGTGFVAAGKWKCAGDELVRVE